MKRLAIIPKFHVEGIRKFVNRGHILLLEKLRDKLGFEFIVNDHIDIPSDVEIVVVFKGVQYSNPETLIELSNLEKNIKLITLFTDLHVAAWTWKDDPDRKAQHTRYIKNMHKICSRADVILTRYWRSFEKFWPQYIDKAIHFPHFFAPHKSYTSLEFNEAPELRGVLTGIADKKAYPNRAFVVDLKFPEIDVIQHPAIIRRKGTIEEFIKDPRVYVNDRYIKLLNSYLVSITTSSVFKYTVGKYFEIPATGALLLCTEADDLEHLGFVPYKHYIPFTKEIFKDVFYDIISNPAKYREVRLNGMNLVHKKHSINNRFIQIKKIIENLV